MAYLLGIDIGTSACKAAVFDENGGVVAQTNRGYNVYYEKPGYAAQNPDDWWNAVCDAIKEITALSGINPGEIAAVGIDGQSWSAIAVDKDGRVLTPTPIWMDTRAQDICDEWASLEDELFALCGNPLKPCYTTPKIGWYKKYLPDVYQNTHKILQSNSYIAYRLTGVFSQDKSQGYGLHFFDIKKGDWNQSLCKELGLRADILPDIYDSSAVIGKITAAAAQQTGLPQGIPVTAGGLDAACGTLGAGVIHPGQTQEQGGQAGGMSICLDSAKSDPRLILGAHVIPDRWLLQGGTTGGGGVMKWLHAELGGGQSMPAMDEMAAKVSPGSEGTVFLPYMAGERSPIWDANAKGVFFGLDFSKTQGHLIRAALEGVAFSLKHNLDVAKNAGAEVDELISMGGAANSKLWTQIKADITGKTIKVPSSDTATTLGAVMLAGVGVGLYSDFEDAVAKTVKITREHKPNEENNSVYMKNYEIYLDLYENLKETMKKAGEVL